MHSEFISLVKISTKSCWCLLQWAIQLHWWLICIISRYLTLKLRLPSLRRRLLDIILGKRDHQNLIDRIFLLLFHHSRMKLIWRDLEGLENELVEVAWPHTDLLDTGIWTSESLEIGGEFDHTKGSKTLFSKLYDFQSQLLSKCQRIHPFKAHGPITLIYKPNCNVY